MASTKTQRRYIVTLTQQEADDLLWAARLGLEQIEASERVTLIRERSIADAIAALAASFKEGEIWP